MFSLKQILLIAALVFLFVVSSSFSSSGYAINMNQNLMFSTTNSVTTPTNSIYPMPRSNSPASNIYVISGDGSFQDAIPALQGIVNRGTPQIFLVYQSIDNQWLSIMQRDYGISYQTISIHDYFQKFASYVTSSGNVKIVEYAAGNTMQFNMARTIAGVDDALPMSSNEISSFQSVTGLSTSPVANIISICSSIGCGSDGVAAFTWLWSNYGSKTTRDFIALAPNGRVQITDYYMEWKAFVWSLNANGRLSVAQSALAKLILKAYSSGAPMIGFFGLGGEVPTIALLSAGGHMTQTGEAAEDYSVLNGLPILTDLTQPASPAVSFDSAKHYVMWVYSQGDASTYVYDSNYNYFMQKDSSTGKLYSSEIPMVWQLNGEEAQINPPMTRLWYSSLPSNGYQTLIGAPSGGGYSQPESMPNEAWYTQLSNNLAQNSGQHYPFGIFGGSVTKSEISTYLNDWGSPEPYALYLWQGNGQLAPFVVQTACGANVPALSISNGGGQIGGVPNYGAHYTSQDVADTVNQIKKDASNDNYGGHFIYLLMNTSPPGPDFIAKVMRALNGGSLSGEYVPVNGAEFANLYMQYAGMSFNHC